MKNIKAFKHKKYQNSNYTEIKKNIYQTQDNQGNLIFCTAISFEQEPEFEEGDSSANISQYPIEDILDQFGVYVSDFFDDLNNGENNICYYEFSSPNKKDIIKLKKSIVGKHVYNKLKGDYITLEIE